MATGKSERKLGDQWAKLKRSQGAWVVKLPASSLAGLPDWFIVERRTGTRVVEAKLLQVKGSAFVPSQCTRAQRFFLECVNRHGGRASILILGPGEWAEIPVWGDVEAVSRDAFYREAKGY